MSKIILIKIDRRTITKNPNRKMKGDVIESWNWEKEKPFETIKQSDDPEYIYGFRLAKAICTDCGAEIVFRDEDEETYYEEDQEVDCPACGHTNLFHFQYEQWEDIKDEIKPK